MNKTFRSLCLITLLLSLGLYLFLLFSPKPVLFEDLSFSQAIYDKQHQLLRLTLAEDEQYRLYKPLSQIPQQLIDATLLQEDQYFFWHFGVNPLSIAQAFWQTYILQSKRRGASTITMQLARIRYGINSKKASGKFWQMIRAIQIERHYSKQQILEAYLNLAPYGGNIEGVGAASLIYFNKNPDALNLSEALTLAVMPQNPVKRRANNPELNSIRDKLWIRWLHLFPQDRVYSNLFHLPLVMRPPAQLPFHAPHFVNKILSEGFSRIQEIHTTLDLQKQNIFERITHHYLARKKNLGVQNAAVLLVDTQTMDIQVLIGSGDFFNQTIEGQINGVDIKRSPGSTLKPFIYGLALDQGLIHPDTILKDVPHSFKGYNPENFDYDFMGPIKAKDALVLSRNIPALDLASQLKNPNLYQLLEQAQVKYLRPESVYGLSLNLGGAELTMQELVSLYAMLVNSGIWYPLNLLKNPTKAKANKLLSPEASFLVLDMLQASNHPVLNVQSQTPLSWKTGTSSGYRDAWTVGAFGPYVLAVWLGNFDNKANPALVGKDLAAPLFLELIEALKEKPDFSKRIQQPQFLNLRKIAVCKASGLLPTQYCSDTELVWFIPGKSPIKRDTIFREVAINPKTGLRTCHIDEQTRFEIFEFWPSDLLRIFKRAGIQRHTPPFFEPACVGLDDKGLSPQIMSPQAGVSYILRDPTQGHNQIPLSAVTDAGVASLYWFINETYIGKTKPNQNFLWDARPGSFVIRVVDDRGLSDARLIKVSYN